MRKAVRAIVIKDNNLLIMRRNKFGQKYATLPGGNVRGGETLEQALVREVMDETSVSLKDLYLRYIEHAGVPYGDQYVFSAQYVSGTPSLGHNAEEGYINKLGKNLYQPAWLPLSELEFTPFMSEHLKKQLLLALPDKLPIEPIEFSW